MAIRSSQQWSSELFSQALQGWSDDAFANAVVVDFDRSLLRSSWKLPWSCGGSLGSLALTQDDHSAQFLRRALERIAQMRMPSPPTWRVMQERQMCFFEIDEGEAFIHALFWTQRLLLDYDASNPMSALVYWWLYADETSNSPHLYRLSISYSPSWRNNSYELIEQEPVQDVEIWYLFSNDSRRIKSLETAWQRYIMSWLRTQELRHEPLHLGLHLLWSWLK